MTLPEPYASFPGLSCWCIYDKPLDLPTKFVVREWRGLAAALHADTFDTLEAARAFLKARNLVPIRRHTADDPVIVETWI